MLHVALPDELKSVLTPHVRSEDELPRWILETVVIEAYREGLLSRGKLGELLGLSFQECEELLAARGVPYLYDQDDLQADATTLDEVLGPLSR